MILPNNISGNIEYIGTKEGNYSIKVITTNWYKFNKMSSYDEMLDNFRNKLNLLNKEVINLTETKNSYLNQF